MVRDVSGCLAPSCERGDRPRSVRLAEAWFCGSLIASWALPSMISGVGVA